MFTLGEAASGAAMAGAIAPVILQMRPVAALAEIAFKKVAKGKLTAHATTSRPGAELMQAIKDEGTVAATDPSAGLLSGGPNTASNDAAAPQPAGRPASSTGAKQLRAQLLGDISAFCRIHRNAIAPEAHAATSRSNGGAIGGLTGRAIARIFHGLTSPQYPAYEWSRDPCWGRPSTADVSLILSLANQTVEAMRRKRAAQDKADAADMAAKTKRALEAEAAHAAKRECAERAGAGTGAVLVYASDSEEDICGAAEGTGDDAHAATIVSSCGEADLCGDGDGASSDGEQTAEGEEEYDSEEL
jgi:hypothetical protein